MQNAGIKVSVSELKSIVKVFRTIVDKKSRLPEFAFLAFERALDGRCHVRYCNIDRVHLRMDLGERGVEDEAFSILAPWDVLCHYAKNLNSGHVTIGIGESDTGIVGVLMYDINGSLFEHSWPYMSMEHYVPPLECQQLLYVRLGDVEKKEFFNAMEVASDDESRYVLNSVLLERCDNGSTVVSTDGRALYKSNIAVDMRWIPLRTNEDQLVISTHIMTLWNKEFRSAGDWYIFTDVRDWFDASESSQMIERVCIRSGVWTLTFRMVCGEYPNYRQVIPFVKPSAPSVVIGDNKDAASVAGLVQHTKIANGTTNRFGEKGCDLIIKCADGEPMQFSHSNVGGGEIDVAGSLCTGDAIACLNRGYVLMALSFGFKKLFFGDPPELSPVVFSDKRNGHRLMIIMPIRMN